VPSPDGEAAEKIDTRKLREHGVAVCESGVKPAREPKRREVKTAVVSTSKNCNEKAPRKKGWHIVAKHLSEIKAWGSGRGKLPSALHSVEQILQRAEGRHLALFLDYDGTLTPIVEDPQKALMSDSMRSTVSRLAQRCTVAVISGRDLEDVREKVGIAGIVYAGSHGFDIIGPEKDRLQLQQGKDFLPALDRAERLLKIASKKILGTVVERKRFSVAVHYRNIKRGSFGAVKLLVDTVAHDVPELRKSKGKKIFELHPRMNWHKGKALLWILDALELGGSVGLPIAIGDDVTDEDAFRVLKDRGIAVAVGETPRATAAAYWLKNPAEVETFLGELAARLHQGGRP
jgi:trehalose 6-phosphate phosphatase